MKKPTRLFAMFNLRYLLLLPLFVFNFASPSWAGTFSSDFNSGVLPAGTAVYGVATNDTTGGFTNSGVLKLTTAINSVSGSYVINDLDAGQPIQSFVATFKALVGGGGGADGFSFNFANDLPDSTFGFAGAGTGLSVFFDTYPNAPELAPAIRVYYGGSAIVPEQLTPLRTGSSFVDVMVKLDPDGTLDVVYNGTLAISNVTITAGAINTVGRFGLGANTGGLNDNHFIDNLTIITKTNVGPYVESAAPLGSGVRPDAALKVVLNDLTTQVDANSILLTLDGSTVIPTISNGAGATTVSYQPPTIFASGSTHSVSITFADNGTPTPTTNTFQYGFGVTTFSALATNLAVSPSFVNLALSGFNLRYSQVADAGSRDIIRAESQLANLLIDGSTGLPYDNLAAPNPADNSFTFQETNVINYSFNGAGAEGNFPADAAVPGIPGPTTGNGSSYAMDAVTYLHLSPGFYKLGVNSSDGFKLAVADGADVFAPVQAIFSSVRAAADTTVSFSVSADGYYPFRLVFFTGDPGYAPGPGTLVPSVEFFNVDSSGNKALIDDTNVVGYVPAFAPAATKPFVRSVNPAIGDTGVPGNTAISATLVDGSLTVQTGTIVLQVNGTTVTPTISSSAGVYTVNYQPPTVFLPNSTNLVSLAFTDSGSNRRTNTWTFTVANIMTPIWSVGATNGTWVTANSTERGLAYNPKTGHLILISRAAAPAPAAGLGIAILDSTNGSVIGTMSIGDIATAGSGTFKLSLVSVAADGVIYGCNLSTSVSAGNPFRIYRWQDESSVPQLVYVGGSLGGESRCGDAFRVRGSGSGTVIIANGNSAVTTSPIFTTVDGTNFTGVALSPAGLPSNVIRLGLAFGCGNTFYGETTGQPVSYIGYTSPTSTTGSLIARYDIRDKNTNQSFGPIGVDIINQRIIGNQTVAPHNINLYDLPTLSPVPTQNFPIDQRNYASQNTSFGTGAIDFTPDGSRVFCLDTGNGIIAFSLAPRLAAPTICSQPKTNFYAAGALAFVDVGASGSVLRYQWKKDGVVLVGATNRTLDIPNFQVANAGLYSVVITNTFAGSSSVTSSNALLDVTMLPVISPASQVVSPGSPATFNVTENGGKPSYTYQWKLNGSNISSATSSSYTIASAQVANAGGYTIVVTDSLGQSVTSPVAILTVGTVGSGTGLTGDYYSNQDKTFTAPPTLTRLDPTVDFDWVLGSPDGSISTDTFTARWLGEVQPFYSQTYTFYTITDDGVRLWVNGQLLIDKWVGQAQTEWSGTITLTANQKYSILMEYYEGTGGAAARLRWSSANQAKQIIPVTQLYPGVSGSTPPLRSQLIGSDFIISWDGTHTLLSSSVVEGPYSPVAGATISPYTNSIGSSPQMFFRLGN